MFNINVNAIIDGLQNILMDHFVNGTTYDLTSVAEILYNNGYDDKWGDDDDAPCDTFNPVIPNVNLMVIPDGTGRAIAFYADTWIVVTADSVKHIANRSDIWK